MLLGLVVIFLLQGVQRSTQQQPFQLIFQRIDNVITFQCRNASTGAFINVEVNTNFKFYLNFTQGDRIGPSNLDERLTLSRSGERATFLITRQLSGYYSCGTGPGQLSNILSLIAFPTTNLPDNLQTNYTVQAGTETVTLRCPYEPGSLLSCYYGDWRTANTLLVSVPQPRATDCTPGNIMNENSFKYRLDKNTFSLVINSPQASTDNGEYYCELRILDPATTFGVSHTFRSSMLNLEVIDSQLITDHEATSTTSPSQSVDNGAQNTGPNGIVLTVSVIVLAVITIMLFVALAVVCICFARSRFKMRNEVLYQPPYYSQPIVPPLPQPRVPPLPQPRVPPQSQATNPPLPQPTVPPLPQPTVPPQPQSTIPPLPQQNRRTDSTSDVAISNDQHDHTDQHNQPQSVEISHTDFNESLRDFMIPDTTTSRTTTPKFNDVLSAEEQNEFELTIHVANITLDRNLAYDTNVAVAPEITTEENIAYLTSTT